MESEHSSDLPPKGHGGSLPNTRLIGNLIVGDAGFIDKFAVATATSVDELVERTVQIVRNLESMGSLKISQNDPRVGMLVASRVLTVIRSTEHLQEHADSFVVQVAQHEILSSLSSASELLNVQMTSVIAGSDPVSQAEMIREGERAALRQTITTGYLRSTSADSIDWGAVFLVDPGLEDEDAASRYREASPSVLLSWMGECDPEIRHQMIVQYCSREDVQRLSSARDVMDIVRRVHRSPRTDDQKMLEQKSPLLYEQRLIDLVLEHDALSTDDRNAIVMRLLLNPGFTPAAKAVLIQGNPALSAFSDSAFASDRSPVAASYWSDDLQPRRLHVVLTADEREAGQLDATALDELSRLQTVVREAVEPRRVTKFCNPECLLRSDMEHAVGEISIGEESALPADIVASLYIERCVEILMEHRMQEAALDIIRTAIFRGVVTSPMRKQCLVDLFDRMRVLEMPAMRSVFQEQTKQGALINDPSILESVWEHLGIHHNYIYWPGLIRIMEEHQRVLEHTGMLSSIERTLSEVDPNVVIRWAIEEPDVANLLIMRFVPVHYSNNLLSLTTARKWATALTKSSDPYGFYGIARQVLIRCFDATIKAPENAIAQGFLAEQDDTSDNDH